MELVHDFKYLITGISSQHTWHMSKRMGADMPQHYEIESMSTWHQPTQLDIRATIEECMCGANSVIWFKGSGTQYIQQSHPMEYKWYKRHFGTGIFGLRAQSPSPPCF